MKKRKFIDFLTVAVVVAAVALSVGCAQDAKKTSTDELPVIVIGSDEYEPYNFSDKNGEPAGIDVEIATEAFGRMEVDCLWGCFSMNGRENMYQWAGPYMNSRQAVAVRADSDIYKLSDLAGKSVAVQSSSKPEELLSGKSNNMPQVGALYCFVKTDYIFAALNKGYVDAIAGHEFMLHQLVNDDDGKYRLLDENLLISKLGVAFYKDNNTEIPDRLNSVLNDMLKDGTIAKIAEKYGLDNEAAFGGIVIE